MPMCVVFLLGILLFVQDSDCQCNFPIQGNWYMSKNNERLTFQGSQVTGFTFEGGPLLQNTLTSTYNCIATDGSRYVIQSNVGALEGAGLQYAFTCLHFFSTGNVATFVQATVTGPATAPFLMKYITEAALSADYLNNVCDLATPYPEYRYHVFVSEDVLGSVGVACPGELQGLLTVISPTTACPASLTGCSSSTSVQKGDTTTCSCTGCAAPLYYATNPVRCLLNRTDTTNSRSYVTLINPDLTERFICIVVKESTSASTISFSQRPLQCDENQSSTSATGGEAFTFGKETCPVVPDDGALSATVLSIIGAVVAIIVIIIIVAVIIIIIVCKRRKKREKEKKRLERRAQRREERRRRRLERQDRIRRGLPVSDLDSVSDSDSCYSTQSNTTTVEETDDKPILWKQRPTTPKKLGKKFRKIYDEKGNLIQEEEIPMDSDDSGDETIYTITEDGRQVKKRREKKTRKYIKERKLPNGKKVKELVESDYWSTCSEESIESWEVDPVRAQIHHARLRRKKERDDMILELAQPRQGPIVTRQMYEQKTGSEEHRGSTKTSNFKKLARRKQKRVQEPRDEEEVEDKDVDGPTRDQYMQQYMKKKRLEGVLEDEGFWDEERAKQTAEQIFEFERLDAELERTSTYPDIEFASEAVNDEQTPTVETSTQEVTVEEETKRKNSINRLKDKVRQKGKDEASVKFKEIRRLSGSEYDDDDKTRKQVTARVSQLLTQRLFGDDQPQDVKSALKLNESRKKGRVIFVEEMKQKQVPGTQPNRPRELAPIKKVVGKTSLPGQRRPVIMDPEKAAIYREGLAKDKHIVDALTAEDSWENDYEDGDSDVEEGHSWLSSQTPRNRRSQHTGSFPSVKGHTRDAWRNDELSPRPVGNGKPTVPYTVSAPKFHSYLNFLRGHGSTDRPGHLTDRDASYCRGIRAPKRMSMDDARLRRLLEELYKDKKYMDTIIDAEESKDDEKVKQLAIHGREYLLQMALYWEEKGPLPQRPSVTALGFKLERSKSAFIQDDTDTQRPSIARHKTVC